MKDNTMGSWSDDMPVVPEDENPENWKFLVLIITIILSIILIAVITKKSHGKQENISQDRVLQEIR